MNASDPDITVIIPNWNGMRWLPGCMASLHAQVYTNFTVILVDNGSSDGSEEWINLHHPDVRVISLKKNTGFANAVNEGIRAVDTPFVILLNSDTKLGSGWISALRNALLESDESVAGVCGKMLLMENPSLIENAGDLLSWQGAAEKRGHRQSAAAFSTSEMIFSCCAGGTLYRKSFFDRVGLFDETFFAYLEDIDLGLRGRLFGYRFLYEPSAVLEHHGHGSEIPSAQYIRLTTANRLRLLVKNIPGSIIIKRLPSIVYGQWYFFVCNRKPIQSLLGYWDFLTQLPGVLQQRKTIRKNTTCSHTEIMELLEKKMNQPGLISALTKKMREGRNPS